MKLSFGFAPSPGADRVARHVSPLADYLRAKTEHSQLQIVVLDSFAQVAEALTKNEIAFGWLPPLTFARTEGTGIKLLLQSIRSDSASYHSALFVLEDSPVQALPDLRGKSIAWVTRHSAAGYGPAAPAPAPGGGSPAKETFAGSHAAVVNAVRAGAADAGSTFCTIDLEARPNRLRTAGWTETVDVGGVRFRAVCTFGAIPGDVLCAAPATSYSERVIFVSAMARMHREVAGISIVRGLFGADRFEIALPHHYQTLRQATRELEAVDVARSSAG